MSEQSPKIIDERYTSGEYLEKNPTFHVERADFKASNIEKMLAKHQLKFDSVGDLGCGAGEVLRLLAERGKIGTRFEGFELSPQGFAMCKERVRENLSFQNADLFETEARFDLLISMDVFEHVEDYIGFLRKASKHATYFLYHIPLDMNAQAVLRGKPIVHVRKKLGHLHYYNKDTALATLRDSGYEIIDHMYTPSSLYKPGRLGAYIAWLPRAIFFKLFPHLSVRALGGFSLLVLARATSNTKS